MFRESDKNLPNILKKILTPLFILTNSIYVNKNTFSTYNYYYLPLAYIPIY